jgi:anaerobic selenocysteine-containing dehydrogenase
MIKKSFCRICTAVCGIVVETQDDGSRVLKVRGDIEDPLSGGYTCSKGRALPEMHHRADRLLHPEMRIGGELREVGWDEALDDLAAKLAGIIAESGPDAVGFFVGGGCYMDAGAYKMSRLLPRALKTRSVYSDMSVDVISKFLVPELMLGVGGLMNRPDHGRTKLIVYAGTNPLVSHGHTSMLNSPTARMREFTADGEVWVLDPRRTETAAKATRHLQTRPGGDYAVFAYLIRELLRDGADRDYIAAHTQGVELLAAAVEPFELEYAAAASGLQSQELMDFLAAARRAGRLSIETGTGISMSHSANVTQWLSWALMVITGSLDREGGSWVNPGFLHQLDRLEMPLAPETGWNLPGPRSRPELPSIAGEYPCAAMADEIEAGNLRALINLGGNLVTCMPQTDRTVAALQKLDVLATVEVQHSATTAISTHALPSKDQLERADLSFGIDVSFPSVATLYTPPAARPLGEVRSFWWILAQIGKRLGFDAWPGLDADQSSDEDMLARILADARETFEMGDTVRYVEAEDRAIGWLHTYVENIGGWRLAPPSLVEQLGRMKAPLPPLVMISRREHHHCNSRIFTQRDRPAIFVNPLDAAAAGLAEGDLAKVGSVHGEIEGAVAIEAGLRRGVLQVPHGWEGRHNVNIITGVTDVDPLTGMPRYSGLPVTLTKVGTSGSANSAPAPM